MHFVKFFLCFCFNQIFLVLLEKWSETPLKEYFIKKGAKYRFRVICHGVYYPFRISVDSHTLTIVSSDGYDVKPQEFESFIINPGERYDFVITANQTIGSYWIRANTLEVYTKIFNNKLFFSITERILLNFSFKICFRELRIC